MRLDSWRCRMKSERKFEGGKRFGIGKVAIMLQDIYKFVVQLLFRVQLGEGAVSNAIEQRKV